MKQLLKLLAASCIMFNLSAYAENLAITGATIHTMGPKGLIENGTVLVKDGKISQVISGLSIPNGYRQIDAEGKVLTPGLVASMSNIGLVEVSLSAGVNDARVDPHPISSVGAAFDAQYGINSDSTLIDITRLEGFTSAISAIARTGKLFNGQGAVMSLHGGFNNLVKAQAFMHLDASNSGVERNGESRAAFWVALNQSLEEAEFALNYEFNPSNEWHGITSRADALALARLVNGDLPLLVSVHRANDILQVLKLVERHNKIRLVLVGVSDGWRVASQIAAAEVPVILSPEQNLPGDFDQLGATLQNAARLNKAGVKIAIGIDTHNARLATQHAGNAVANGLPHGVAMAALTTVPAEIFGLEDQLGSIEAGKIADLVIWSGDPLEVTEYAEQVYIGGKAMPMESRQTKLRDRYLDINKTKPVTYSH